MAKKQPHPVDVYVGQRIIQARRVKGISQEALSEAIDLTFQQIQKYEKAQNRVSASRLVQIANALDVDVGFFFDGAPGVNPAKETDPIIASAAPMFCTATGVRIATSFPKIVDGKLRAAIANLIEDVAGGAP